ncbi:hypothetical protein BBP40_004778 [Aspergillus hancockii]|nr:hypothetical protein BBP40_004778 [Aspergillus hancockii]
MAYRAEFRNSSSETWKDAQVTLSTSQASFSKLEERIPSLQPWYIKLLDVGEGESKEHPTWDNILDYGYTTRSGLFDGVAQPQPQQASTSSLFGGAQPSSGNSLFGGATQTQPAQPTATGSGEVPAQPQQASSGGLFGRAQPSQDDAEQGPSPIEDDNEDDEEYHDIKDPLASLILGHQESVKQDYGLTTTYDLPGHRTLIPSNNNRRHMLADLDLKNSSSLNILRGQVGLTADGTFLGTATIRNCAPDGFFNLSLGVDPSILVRYDKPSVSRTTPGFFTKEAGAVPMSDDEELDVQVLEPKGLDEKEDETNLDMEASHGRGTPTIEKKGEIKWVIHLEPGKDVRVVLKYGTKAPKGSEVVTV